MTTEHRFEIDSRLLADRLAITLVQTPGNSPPGQAAPLVYLLDSFFTLPPTVGAAHTLGLAALVTGGAFPALRIAGVGYATEDPREIVARRFRDLTPTAHGAPEGVTLPTPPLGAGGAAQFLQALTEEIMPAVEARLPEPPSSRALVGFSFSGLFGLYTLFHQPEVFDRYLLVSPSIWWDRAIALRLEQAWVDRRRDLPARVFLSIGELEQVVGDTWLNEWFPSEAMQRMRNVDKLRDLAAQLQGRGYSGLSVDGVVFAGEYHLSVFPAAVTRGLLQLYTNTRPQGEDAGSQGEDQAVSAGLGEP